MKSKIQFDLFVEENELSLLHKEVQDLHHQNDKLKRQLYTRHNDLSRLCLQLKEENEELKQRLTRLEKLVQTQTPAPSKAEDDLLEKLFREAYLLGQ